MKWIPEAHCPKCKGPITFFDVLGIVTPFQCIYCVSCGEMVFLKHRWTFLSVAVLAGVLMVLFSIEVVTKSLASMMSTFVVSLISLVALEIVMTGYVVKKNDLVVRRP
ncbi:MAG TPA: hypothetical protein PKB12_02200 [Elusimicrobiota bacterium]|jgi:prepilin signal peptidase PulO-like enzyme (type II secretory pathway)|nr:hypothetical protein [Elusimicrobiota bacterium]HMX42512.1 hypothetical protein [Elusimicrobiota bacterium]HNC75407.1 hypothetical protein [Elusimicrobiota bacterium]HNG44245.1 hypothetical protein [Elusimicrobiota bacterium]